MQNRTAMHLQPKIPKERKIGKKITIKFDFGAKYREAQKHLIAEK